MCQCQGRAFAGFIPAADIFHSLTRAQTISYVVVSLLETVLKATLAHLGWRAGNDSMHFIERLPPEIRTIKQIWPVIIATLGGARWRVHGDIIHCEVIVPPLGTFLFVKVPVASRLGARDGGPVL